MVDEATGRLPARPGRGHCSRATAILRRHSAGGAVCRRSSTLARGPAQRGVRIAGGSGYAAMVACRPALSQSQCGRVAVPLYDRAAKICCRSSRSRTAASSCGASSTRTSHHPPSLRRQTSAWPITRTASTCLLAVPPEPLIRAWSIRLTRHRARGTARQCLTRLLLYPRQAQLGPLV